MMSSGGGESGSAKFRFILYFWLKYIVFFLTRVKRVKFLFFSSDVVCEWSLANKNELQFTLDDWNFEGDKVTIMLHKNKYFRISERISIGGIDRLIKCPYNGFHSLWLMEYSSYQESKYILLK